MAKESKIRSEFRLHPRSISILESVRDENLLPSLNAAINFLIQDYRRLRDEHDSVKVPLKLAQSQS